MADLLTKPSLAKTPHGYYGFDASNISEDNLREYYANKYYQEGRGSYATFYDDEEIRWFSLKANLVFRKVASLTTTVGRSLVDVGCGEGWLMAEFLRQGWAVKGLDYSIEGISKFNPNLLPYFEQCDIFTWLSNLSGQNQQYDVVSIMNVIEHVKDPVDLLRALRNLVKPGGLMVVLAPNDFSPLHDYLLAEGYISEPWWIVFPDHLSYFNKESMINLLHDTGYQVSTVVADNPIDLNLLNDNSNYIQDKSKGKSTHLFRVRVDNFLGDIDRDKLLALYEVMGSMGVGRNLAYYCHRVN